MSLLLLVLGILLAGAGAAAIGFGIPIRDLTLGNTLIAAGTTGLVGGLLMIGLSAAVAELSAIVRSLKAGPAVGPVRTTPDPAVVAVETLPTREPAPIESTSGESRIPPEGRPAPAPPAATPAPAVEVSASAIERLRSSIPRADRSVPVTEGVPLSPNGQPQPAEPPRSADAAAGQAREPRLDFLFRSRQAAPPGAAPQQSQPESFDALWPKRPGREPQVGTDQKAEEHVEPRLESAVEERRTAPPPAAPAVNSEPAPTEYAPSPSPPPSSAETIQRSVAILKSGVVDGMAYTLYADGSIEAQLPQGTVRFGSIAELRAHIENNS